jgi:hypothetical protein
MHGRLIKTVRHGDGTPVTLDDEGKIVAIGTSTTKAKEAEEVILPNPLLEMSNADADDQVIEWLRTCLAANEPLLDRCRRDHTTISEIAKVFKLWEAWVKAEGSWDFDKASKTRTDNVLGFIGTACNSFQALSTINDKTRNFVEDSLERVTRMRDALQGARQGN